MVANSCNACADWIETSVGEIWTTGEVERESDLGLLIIDRSLV